MKVKCGVKLQSELMNGAMSTFKLFSFYSITNIIMEKFYVITVLKDKERKDFYFKDMAMAIIQFREFMEQAGITERIE